MFVLDSNTIIHAFQGKGRVAERLAAVPPSRLAIPAIALFEVELGVLKSRNSALRRKHLSQLADACRILAFDDQCARLAAKLRVDLEDSGCVIGPLDTLIAATALAHAATLVTRNTREFQRVPGLKIEDWF